MRNVVEKTSKGMWKKRMTWQANNQVPTPDPSHNFKHVQCESEGK
jgi:hypothetical protein